MVLIILNIRRCVRNISALLLQGKLLRYRNVAVFGQCDAVVQYIVVPVVSSSSHSHVNAKVLLHQLLTTPTNNNVELSHY